MSEEPTQATIMSLEEIKEGLKDKRLYAVAKKIDLSYPTLRKIVIGEDSNPTHETMVKISNYLQAD